MFTPADTEGMFIQRHIMFTGPGEVPEGTKGMSDLITAAHLVGRLQERDILDTEQVTAFILSLHVLAEEIHCPDQPHDPDLFSKALNDFHVLRTEGVDQLQ